MSATEQGYAYAIRETYHVMLHVSWTVLKSLGCLNVAFQGRLQAFCRSADMQQPDL